MDINLTPPTNNPLLPSYEIQEFLDNKYDYEFLEDMFVGRSKWFHPLKGVVNSEKANAYLPKNPVEPVAEYTRRVATPFSPRFEMSVNGFTGLLSNFTFDGPSEFEEHFDDVDLMGNSLAVFAKGCDSDALKFGRCYVMAEYPNQEPTDIKSKSLYDDQYSTSRPYLSRIDPRDVPNLKRETINGKLVITEISIREIHELPNGFGVRQEALWRVLRPGSWELYDIVLDDNNGEWTAILIDAGTTSLDLVPVVEYSIGDTDKRTPMFGLAELVNEQYKLTSDHRTNLHKCNLPVSILTGNVDLGGSGGNLIIGPNSFLSLPADSSFSFVSPDSSVFGTNRQEIEAIDLQIDLFNINVMGRSEANKTATQVAIESKSTESSLALMAKSKESLFNTLFSFWAQFKGLTDGGTITINKDFLVPPNTPEQVVAVFNAGIISHITAIRELSKLGMVADPEAELALIDGEKLKAIAEGAVFGQQQEEEPLNGEAPLAEEEDEPTTN